MSVMGGLFEYFWRRFFSRHGGKRARFRATGHSRPCCAFRIAVLQEPITKTKVGTNIESTC